MNRNRQDPDDPDWAPQLPSIWDDEDDDGHEESGYSWDRSPYTAYADPFSSPLPVSERGLDWHDPKAWFAAETQVGRDLLNAATAVARLDERLLRMPVERRDGLRRRIALSVTSDILWAEGVRLRPEHLALADRDRVGRSMDEDQAISRAAWAVRRMTLKTESPVTPVAVRRFLGLHTPHADALPSENTDLIGDVLWTNGLDAHAADDWCLAQAALKDAHPLTRAAAGLHLWRGFGLSAPERFCEPLVLAARISGDMAQGGLIAVPVSFPAALRSGKGTAADRLRHWCALTHDNTMQIQGNLDDLEAWRIRAEGATRDLNGKSPAALIALMEANPVQSAKDCASALQRTPTQTRQILNTFEDTGLIVEITGHKRFRFWKARM